MGRRVLSGRLIGALATSLLLCGFTDYVLLPSLSKSGFLLIDGPGRVPNDTSFRAYERVSFDSWGTGPGEVILFPAQADGAVRMVPVDWSEAEDVLSIAPAPLVKVPVSVWIFHAPNGELVARRDASMSLLMANAILDCENAGIRISDVRTHYRPLEQATNGSVLAFDCDDTSEAKREGWDEGRLNIYIVNSVLAEGTRETTNGHACRYGSGMVFLGFESAPHLLAHELGHNLALRHTTPSYDSDGSNAMAASSNLRCYLTEGQIFRAHHSPVSYLNRQGGRVAGSWRSPLEPRRVCTVDSADSIPAISLRLRADSHSISCPCSPVDPAEELRRIALRVKKRLPIVRFDRHGPPPPPGPLPERDSRSSGVTLSIERRKG